MKVYLAAQVFLIHALVETHETQRFCYIFDRFFDCLNVRAYSEAQKKLKPDLAPYRTIEDPCFMV